MHRRFFLSAMRFAYDFSTTIVPVIFGCGWLSHWLFGGPGTRSFRSIAFSALILLFLWIRGAFITSNHRFTFFVREFVFALVIAAVALFGLYVSGRSERHI